MSRCYVVWKFDFALFCFAAMVKHNNVLPNQHFHKDWENRVKTWFDQAARKKRRRTNRKLKASLVAPRPVAGPLRPVVHCQTVKYNNKLRAGRGFTLDEIKASSWCSLLFESSRCLSVRAEGWSQQGRGPRCRHCR